MKKMLIVIFAILLFCPFYAKGQEAIMGGPVDFHTGRVAKKAVHFSQDFEKKSLEHKKFSLKKETEEENKKTAKKEALSSLFSLFESFEEKKEEWVENLADRGIVYNKRVGVIITEKNSIMIGANMAHGDLNLNLSPNSIPNLRVRIEEDQVSVGFKGRF